MAFIPVIVCVNIPFYQLLLISDHGKSSTKILSWGALVCILLNVLLIPYFSVLGTALALLVTESMISILVILKAKNTFLDGKLANRPTKVSNHDISFTFDIIDRKQSTLQKPAKSYRNTNRIMVDVLSYFLA
jgi:Na+-driven multidrug efflux pump